MHYGNTLNLYQTTKYQTCPKCKAFVDDKIGVIKKFKFVVQMLENIVEILENIVGKGENAGNQHFLLFPQCFQKTSTNESL